MGHSICKRRGFKGQVRPLLMVLYGYDCIFMRISLFKDQVYGLLPGAILSAKPFCPWYLPTARFLNFQPFLWRSWFSNVAFLLRDIDQFSFEQKSQQTLQNFPLQKVSNIKATNSKRYVCDRVRNWRKQVKEHRAEKKAFGRLTKKYVMRIPAGQKAIPRYCNW